MMRCTFGVLLLQFLIAICLFSSVAEKQQQNDSNPPSVLEIKHTYQVSSISKPKSDPLSFMGALSRARNKSFAGGYSGFIAGAIQVITLMWLRTTVNYQYRYGVTMMEALRELNRQGGVKRFYRGLPYALVQGPLAKFGGIAANDASVVFAAYLTGQSELMSTGMLSTAIGSILAGIFRHNL